MYEKRCRSNKKLVKKTTTKKPGCSSVTHVVKRWTRWAPVADSLLWLVAVHLMHYYKLFSWRLIRPETSSRNELRNSIIFTDFHRFFLFYLPGLDSFSDVFKKVNPQNRMIKDELTETYEFILSMSNWKHIQSESMTLDKINKVKRH